MVFMACACYVLQSCISTVLRVRATCCFTCCSATCCVTPLHATLLRATCYVLRASACCISRYVLRATCCMLHVLLRVSYAMRVLLATCCVLRAAVLSCALGSYQTTGLRWAWAMSWTADWTELWACVRTSCRLQTLGYFWPGATDLSLGLNLQATCHVGLAAATRPGLDLDLGFRPGPGPGATDWPGLQTWAWAGPGLQTTDYRPWTWADGPWSRQDLN
jgi:hypothetical protein